MRVSGPEFSWLYRLLICMDLVLGDRTGECERAREEQDGAAAAARERERERERDYADRQTDRQTLTRHRPDQTDERTVLALTIISDSCSISHSPSPVILNAGQERVAKFTQHLKGLRAVWSKKDGQNEFAVVR